MGKYSCVNQKYKNSLLNGHWGENITWLYTTFLDSCLSGKYLHCFLNSGTNYLGH